MCTRTHLHTRTLLKAVTTATKQVVQKPKTIFSAAAQYEYRNTKNKQNTNKTLQVSQGNTINPNYKGEDQHKATFVVYAVIPVLPLLAIIKPYPRNSQPFCIKTAPLMVSPVPYQIPLWLFNYCTSETETVIIFSLVKQA